jgi:uncharacterized protein with GYD domain
MPLYILLGSLTDEGRKTVKSKPDRIQKVNKEIEGMSAKVLGQFMKTLKVSAVPR